MRLTQYLITLLIACGLNLGQVTTLHAADEALCYAAADDENQLIASWRTGGGWLDIGPFGASSIEAITFNLDDSILYGTNAGTLGSINISTGSFTAIGAAGSADGAVGTVTVDDLDGLAFDDSTGHLYAAQREDGDDLLVRLDPATGAVVQNHFGPGVDYVVILASPITGFDDIDDIAVDPTDGQMYAISNDGGTDDRLVKIDKTDGSVIDVGAFIGTDDMEGLSVTPDGELYGTTGYGGGNSKWNIDKLNGFATFVFAYPGYEDIEGIACLRSNIITGTVFVDSNSNGVLDPSELGISDVTVRLYNDVNGNGQVDTGIDTLIQTVITPTDGYYEFYLTAVGDYVLDIDIMTLPMSWSLTTDNVEEAVIPDYGNVETGNDFGALGAPGDIAVTKSATASACPGEVITYTVTVTNNGSSTHSGITVGDALPVGATYVDQSTVATGYGAQSNFRVTEYYVDAGDWSENNFDLTLNQNLVQNYFVIIQGSDGDGSSSNDRGPDENYGRLVRDPDGTGDLGVSSGANVIRVRRYNDVNDWRGVITVVECVADCTASGFTLLSVERARAASGTSSGSTTSAAAWSDIDQVSLIGGFNGAGCLTPESDDEDAPVCHKRIWPSGTDTINWSRDVATDRADSTVMVVEWGSEWTVQRVNVAANPANSGDGVDSTGDYETATITSVARDNTWVWGTGWTDENGPGDSAEGVVITLGDGVNQNTSETEVAVGIEHGGTQIDFEVYALTHPDLVVDYRFKPDGDSGFLAVNVATDAAGSERMALSYNGADDTGNNNPRSMFSARYLTDSSIQLERRRSGTEFPAWVQGIDFSNIGGGASPITKDNIPGDTYGDLADGVPPALVTAADSFRIPSGGSMTVTFQATVDNPYHGASPLINAASGRSAEGGFDIDSAGSAVSLATIGNLVWHDFHQNGIQDASEPGIPDVPTTVYGPGPDGNLGTGDDVYVSSTFTDANGNYSFPNLGPGEYRVEVNAVWLAANGYPDQIYPTPDSKNYWDLDDADLSLLSCGGTEDNADFGYWDGTTVPVTLSSFQATEGRSGTLFEWTTATQVGTVGFNLYAVNGPSWHRINSELIPAHTPDSVVPQHYRYEAEDIDAESFAIEDVDIRGRRERHGPFAAAKHHGLDSYTAPESAIDWPSIRSEHLAKVEARRVASPRVDEVSFSKTAEAGASRRRGDDRRKPLNEIVQLAVETDGICRVSHNDLLDFGIDLTGISAERLALRAGGEAVPIFIRGGPVFGPGSAIEWVAHGLETLYTKKNIYVLNLDPRQRARVVIDWREPEEGIEAPDSYLETVTAERNLSYSFAAPNGDPWYDTAILAFTEPEVAEFEITIDELADEGDATTLRIDMWGTTDWEETPDHHVEVAFNHAPMADEIFDGLRNYPLEIELPPGLLEEGTNVLELTLPGDTGVAYDMVTFDRFSVTYPRRFVARDGRLEFTAAGEVLRVEGLPSPNAVVYRVKGNVVTLVAVKEMTQEAGGYVATFRGSSEPARYLVSAPPAIGTPQLERVHDGSSILKGEADYLVIAHPDFIDGLEALITARENEGWRIKVVDVEAVYAQFSHGIIDPEALRSYISYAAEHLETEMVLLVGGDTYDYHDFLGLGSLSFIPSLYVATGEIVQFTPADPLFTDIDGDNVPDLPIGRMPVRTSEELEIVVDKTLDYAAKSYPRRAVFAADKDDASGESFTAISNAFISELPEGWRVVTTYLEERSLESARRILIREFNRGTSLASYFGHSGPTVWSFDNLFHVSDAHLLKNHRMPTVVTQWGCWNNYYVEPTHNTMGHAFLLSGDQGAAAVLGASTLTQSASDQALGERFIPRLAKPGTTIGAALQKAKEELALEDPGRIDVLLGWTLLGDPALVVDPQ